MRYTADSGALSLQGAGGGRTRGNSWELPILGKYYFTDRRSIVRPFASSGFSLRKTWFDDGDRYGSIGRPGQRRTGPFDGSSDLGAGAVVSGGASFGGWKCGLHPKSGIRDGAASTSR
jgi:hypothetical protein